MKKLLILILIALLLALCGFIDIQGVSLGSVKILGIREMQDKNADLEEKIQEATSLVQKDYASAKNQVEQSSETYETTKKDYEDKVIISEGGEIEELSKPYDIETLWVRIGNHAKRQGVVMNMNVGPSTTGADGTYDLDFTVTGTYICITDFISAIENDSTLGFKIEEFKMGPSGSDLQATFTCKDISINKEELNTSTVMTTQNTNTANTTNTNTTNNTTNSSNATNSTNTSGEVEVVE